MADALTPAQREQIDNEIFAGKKIQAIKLYREATNTGLKEAKDAVEAFERDLRVSSPEKFTASPAKAGCTGVLLFLLLPTVVVGWLCWR